MDVVQAVEIHRKSSASSTLSSFGQVGRQPHSAHDEEQVRERSRERHADPLGLNVVYEPDTAPTLDLILVHGLGGTSRKTWSHNRDIELFWPREWLPHEPGFSTTRVLTFGYNAHFAAAGRENILNIGDFARDLLFGMKFALNERAEELEIGKVSASQEYSECISSQERSPSFRQKMPLVSSCFVELDRDITAPFVLQICDSIPDEKPVSSSASPI